MTETECGLDIVLEGVAAESPASLGAFAGKAGALGVARLTADGESIGRSPHARGRSLRRTT